MQTVGNITGYIDLAQILLYVFWLFFAGLIWYLVMEITAKDTPWNRTAADALSSKGFQFQRLKLFCSKAEEV
jgi:photosynthetic reaction center H subunit